MSQRISTLILAAAGAICADGATWNSQLFPKGLDGKYTIRTVEFAGRAWTLDDFSYVGYELGQKSLGTVPCHKTVTIAGKGDISAEVQAAIDVVGRSGGGIVRIPKGTFTMSSAVAIPFDNVSIEGAGDANTRIEVPSDYNSHETPDLAEALFTFGRELNTSNRGWVDGGPVVATVSQAILRGSLQVNTDDASKVDAGAWVVVQQYFWPALVNNNSHSPDAWQANSTIDHSIFSFSYLRRVVSKNGNRVSLDAPIPMALDPANNPIHIRLTDGKMHTNSGIAGMTIAFQPNTDPRTGRPHGTAVYFEGMDDGWAYDVHVLDFPRNGFYADFSARITFLDCMVRGAQDKGGNGYGYGFLESASQNILYRRCQGLETRHNFISSRSLTSMVVYSRNISENATEPDDTHFAFEQAILMDRHTQLNGESVQQFNRGDESSGAYETLASGVIWNFFGDGVPNQVPHGGAIYVKPSPDGEAIVVGVNGRHQVFDNSKGNTVSPFVPGDLMPAAAGLQVGTGTGALGNVLYEGLYQPNLDPESLYDAQLADRIGKAPADFRTGCPILFP